MKLTLLMDSNTLIDRYYKAEPAFACHIQDGPFSLLLDTGYSAQTAENAAALGVDLAALDAVALSHGHNDHTGGLPALLALPRAPGKPPLRLAAHPAALEPKEHEGHSIGCPLTKEELAARCTLELSAEPQQLTRSLTLLGRIPRVVPFEEPRAIGRRRGNGVWLPDQLPDDTALCCRTPAGVFVVTGCAHSGLCNILTRARQCFPGQPITGVLGGFHLLGDDPRTAPTAAWLKEQRIPALYPCHCTGLAARAALMAAGLRVTETGVGFTLEL